MLINICLRDMKLKVKLARRNDFEVTVKRLRILEFCT